MRELYHWSKAMHKNVQPLSGIIMFQGHLGMVSPWMENGNLRDYIKKNPSTDRYRLVSDRAGGTVLSVHILNGGQCIQVAEGVAYLHSIGMVSVIIKGRATCILLMFHA